jgi:hypothetical protein
VLSDLIGFTYAGWAADAAADDFVRRLEEAAESYRRRVRHGAGSAGDNEARIFVILDGENAWEHFEGGGRPFLRALYGRLSDHSELRTVTMAEACRSPSRRLDGIFPGSWIDSNFYIWIGHHDDRQAWGQLADARDIVHGHRGSDTKAAAQAWEEILIAEGSDWFWWYGDDHSSEHDLEFDDLFRRHLRNAYRLLGLAIPDELFVSNISAGAAPPVDTTPVALIAPTVDGEVTSYFEWLDAGCLEIRQTAGAMHQAERQAELVSAIRFGFDRERLFVRVDADRPVVDLLAEGYEFSLKFLVPDGLRYSVKQDDGRLTGNFWHREAEWVRRGPGHAVAGAGTVLEVALPFADLGIVAGDAAAFFVAVYDPQSNERERHPAHRPIEVWAPDARYHARQWSA